MFSSCDHKLGPITLTFELDLDSTKEPQHAKYINQRSFSSFSSNIINEHTGTNRQTHNWIDCVIWTSKVVSKNYTTFVSNPAECRQKDTRQDDTTRSLTQISRFTRLWSDSISSMESDRNEQPVLSASFLRP